MINDLELKASLIWAIGEMIHLTYSCQEKTRIDYLKFAENAIEVS